MSLLSGAATEEAAIAKAKQMGDKYCHQHRLSDDSGKRLARRSQAYVRPSIKNPYPSNSEPLTMIIVVHELTIQTKLPDGIRHFPY